MLTRFQVILAELLDLHNQKGKDYDHPQEQYANVRAGEDFGIPAWVGAMVRANDKMRRIQKVAQGGVLANESIIDSFNDLAIYVIIARILYEESYMQSMDGEG